MATEPKSVYAINDLENVNYVSMCETASNCV